MERDRRDFPASALAGFFSGVFSARSGRRPVVRSGSCFRFLSVASSTGVKPGLRPLLSTFLGSLGAMVGSFPVVAAPNEYAVRGGNLTSGIGCIGGKDSR
jgi:hypothetical protein